jgi:hypothetical protein
MPGLVTRRSSTKWHTHIIQFINIPLLTYPWHHEPVVCEKVQNGVDCVVPGTFGRHVFAGPGSRELAVGKDFSAVKVWGAVEQEALCRSNIFRLKGRESHVRTAWKRHRKSHSGWQSRKDLGLLFNSPGFDSRSDLRLVWLFHFPCIHEEGPHIGAWEGGVGDTCKELKITPKIALTFVWQQLYLL